MSDNQSNSEMFPMDNQQDVKEENCEDAQLASSLSPDNKALRMMQKMGYKSGLGLGKNAQGITIPIEVKSQLGKRGLGLEIPNMESTKEQWDFALENIDVYEKAEWLLTNTEWSFGSIDLRHLMIVDEPQTKNDESQFCERELINNVVKGKDIFDELDINELCKARSKANPFESIRSVFFMNRAALKMANIDAATDFMFTNIDLNIHHESSTEPYYFADVCAGPGGFTEYILWRKKWLFKGFGLTLRDSNDFKISSSCCASPTTFTAIYGAKEDGNVCCPDNIDDFKNKVLHGTNNNGVHFMMSDGGFSVEGNENMQEVLSKNIYISQCLVALEILRDHGHFVTKLFDLFTSFSVGLLFLMHKCFEKVCVIKPKSSRPANSERYFICCNYQKNEVTAQITEYLRHVVDKLWKLKDHNTLDVVEIVPLDVLQADTGFYSYICDTNNRIARNQAISLQKLAAFCRNPALVEHRQEELREQCLRYWKIPHKAKAPPRTFKVDDALSAIIDQPVSPVESTIPEIGPLVQNLMDWYYTPIHSSQDCTYYIGVGIAKAHKWNGNRWVKVNNLHLVQGTVLYGEYVKESVVLKKHCEDDKFAKRYSLHVIDALRLGEMDLTNMPFKKRMEWIKIYCMATNQEHKGNIVRIRQKQLKLFPQILSEKSLHELPVLGFAAQKETCSLNYVLLFEISDCETSQISQLLKTYKVTNESQSEEENSLLQRLQDFMNEQTD